MRADDQGEGRPGVATPRASSLARVGLGTPGARAWALYDWANSAMYTVIVTAVFPVFFLSVVAKELDPDGARRTFSAATTIALLVAAFAGPLLGAIADVARLKKPLLAAFVVLGVASAGAMFTLGPGDVGLGLWLFGLCNVGAMGAVVFYDALLPHVAPEDEIDRLSTAAYALGYLGGGLCLVLCTGMILKPDWFGLPAGEGLTSAQATLPARLSFVVVAAWWGLFSIPIFLRVPEPPLGVEPDERAGRAPIRTALQRLKETLSELRGYREAFLMLVAFLIYNDGIGTIIRMAVVVGEAKKIPSSTMIAVVATVQFVGVPFTLLFGQLAGRFGPKRAILGGLVVYVGICLVAYGLTTVPEFVLLAVLVGMVQGGCQALSRSLFATLIPRYKSGEFFGLFSALEKFAGVGGPLVFALSPSTEIAVLATIGFFVVGGAILTLVDVDAGRARARAAEAAVVRVRDGRS